MTDRTKRRRFRVPFSAIVAASLSTAVIGAPPGLFGPPPVPRSKGNYPRQIVKQDFDRVRSLPSESPSKPVVTYRPKAVISPSDRQLKSNLGAPLIKQPQPAQIVDVEPSVVSLPALRGSTLGAPSLGTPPTAPQLPEETFGEGLANDNSLGTPQFQPVQPSREFRPAPQVAPANPPVSSPTRPADVVRQDDFSPSGAQFQPANQHQAEPPTVERKPAIVSSGSVAKPEAEDDSFLPQLPVAEDKHLDRDPSRAPSIVSSGSIESIPSNPNDDRAPSNPRHEVKQPTSIAEESPVIAQPTLTAPQNDPLNPPPLVKQPARPEPEQPLQPQPEPEQPTPQAGADPAPQLSDSHGPDADGKQAKLPQSLMFFRRRLTPRNPEPTPQSDGTVNLQYPSGQSVLRKPRKDKAQEDAQPVESVPTEVPQSVRNQSTVNNNDFRRLPAVADPVAAPSFPAYANQQANEELETPQAKPGAQPRTPDPLRSSGFSANGGTSDSTNDLATQDLPSSREMAAPEANDADTFAPSSVTLPPRNAASEFALDTASDEAAEKGNDDEAFPLPAVGRPSSDSLGEFKPAQDRREPAPSQSAERQDSPAPTSFFGGFSSVTQHQPLPARETKKKHQWKGPSGSNRTMLDFSHPPARSPMQPPVTQRVSQRAITTLPPVVTRKASLLIEHGFSLAHRDAVYAARAEFVQAIRLVSQALDTRDGVNEHSKALAAGLKALEESHDFMPQGSALEADLDLPSIVATHSTQIISQEEAKDLTPIAVVQRYYTHARDQLVLALGSEPAGSKGLYALGRIHMRLSEMKALKRKRHGQKAVVFHHAALLVDEGNHMAANELGVLLARSGQLEDAKEVFLKSLSIQPRAESWHNLASVHHQLQEFDLAQRAQVEQQRLVAQQNGQPAAATPGSIQWVTPEQFASTHREQAPVPAKAAPAPQPASPAPQKARVQPRVARPSHHIPIHQGIPLNSSEQDVPYSNHPSFRSR